MEKPTRPLYELQIDEENDSVVDAIALVNSPAIESNFLAFSENKKRYTFSEDKMELLGPAMIPNQRIYRYDPEMGEYDVIFTKEQIRHIMQVYSKRGFQSSFNLEHSTIPANSYMFQSYQVDEYNLSPKGMNLPDGSWVVGVKVEDPEIWAEVKAGKLQGFSIEGVFKMLRVKFNSNLGTNVNKDNDAVDIVSDICNLLDKHN
jgi:hypothetical protein